MTSVTRLCTLAATTAVTVLAAGCASQGSAGSSCPARQPQRAGTRQPRGGERAGHHGHRRGFRVPGPGACHAVRDRHRRFCAVRRRRVPCGEPGRERDDRARAGVPAGCPLSGDGTTVLWNMTWPTWTGGQAVGTGTEKIDGCDPNCAAGPEYSVAVTVTFSQPARDCARGRVVLDLCDVHVAEWPPIRADRRQCAHQPLGLHPGQGRSHPVLRLTRQISLCGGR